MPHAITKFTRRAFVGALATPLFVPVSAQPVRLTLDLEQNATFARRVTACISALQKKLGTRLCIPLAAAAAMPSSCARAADDADPEVIVQLYLVRDGCLHRHFSTHVGALDTHTQCGSISKAIGLIALAESGADEHESWCTKSFFNVHNADGFAGYASCSSPGAMRKATESLARSDTLATLERLRRLDEGALRARLLAAGVYNTPLDYHPGIAAATGVLAPRPREVLELFAAVAAGGPVAVHLVDGGAHMPTRIGAWAGAVMNQPSQARYARALLAASVSHPHGTARHLAALLPGQAELYAKTGTSEGRAHNVTGKFLAFSLQHGGHAWSAFCGVQASDPSFTLGRGLQSSHFADLHALLVQEVGAAATRGVALRS